jgi:ABC-type nitrate/sulfonate/bicarbonate transport system ATPase subunit
MLEARDVTKRFFDDHTAQSVLALDGVDLDVADNEFVAIIGPSGCGKTTLLRMFAGLIQPDKGQVSLAGQPIEGPSPERAMVFQSFALMPWSDVVTNVAFGLQLRGVRKRERRERARELIATVGLKGFESYLPGQLSGGMQQRVGLARALAVDPQVLLMDEPFGALDEQTRRLLWEQLLGLWEHERKTVLFVTHSMEEAVVLSDRIVLMSARPGRVAEIIDVDIPRPRPADMESSPRFTEIKLHLWEALRGMQNEALKVSS